MKPCSQVLHGQSDPEPVRCARASGGLHCMLTNEFILSSTPSPDPTSCAEILQCSPGLLDGNYPLVLDPKNSSVELYCHGMNTPYPRAFINLVRENYSLYGGCSFNEIHRPRVKRTYTKIAIDTKVSQKRLPSLVARG